MRILLTCMLLLVSSLAQAAEGYPPAMKASSPQMPYQVPQQTAVAPSQPSSGVPDYLGPDLVPLSPKEAKALSQSTQWARHGTAPLLGPGGKLMFTHGASMPSIIGAPMQVVDVELQQGETLHEIIVGDSARWMVETGKAGDTPHLFIKPVDAGLESSAVITTDRRVYHLRLVSQRTGHTPYVGFLYSDELVRKASAKRAAEDKQKQWSSMSDGSDLSKLNFNYEVKGKARWKPERVYDDGQQTFLRLPATAKSGEMPVLLVRKGSTDVLVNYRVKDQARIVDGIFERIVLIVGVGSAQEKIEVRRAK